MPCYIVQTVSVEFKAKNMDFLIKALEQLEISYTYDAGRMTIKSEAFIIDLNAQKITTIYSSYSTSDVVNRLKRKYSEVVMTEVAKKKRWGLHKKNENKFELRRY